MPDKLKNKALEKSAGKNKASSEAQSRALLIKELGVAGWGYLSSGVKSRARKDAQNIVAGVPGGNSLFDALKAAGYSGSIANQLLLDIGKK